jgi:hypothetical protein
MQTREFIKSLEEKLKVKLDVRPSNFDSMVGIYYDNVYITAAPSSVIKAESDPQYTNEKGYPHKPMDYVEAKIVSFVERYKDPEFKALMTEKLD